MHPFLRFYYLEGWILRGTGGGAKFSEGTRFLNATMFSCKHVISVAAWLLIIHIAMYIVDTAEFLKQKDHDFI